MKTHIKIKNRHLRIFFGDRFNGWDILVIFIIIGSTYGVIKFWEFKDLIKWISLFGFTSVILTWMYRLAFKKAKK